MFFHAILSRGPAIGFQGKVLLAFEDNGSSKIGVRFDRSVPDGNDLGGLCEGGHGFFCTGNFRANIYRFAFLKLIVVMTFFVCSEFTSVRKFC